mmetsp:Transcript_2146/g.6095  ORF Transcript_2146/g.6095 Transcript_2146/m.6095 type:complete len:90 (-) Transcript_2146:934-1203(-)
MGANAAEAREGGVIGAELFGIREGGAKADCGGKADSAGDGRGELSGEQGPLWEWAMVGAKYSQPSSVEEPSWPAGTTHTLMSERTRRAT